MNLSATHLSFAYSPEKMVLHDVSLDLSAGETLYVLGRNGGGKTTLLACLAGLLNPEKGEVFIDNRNLLDYSATERAKLIGLIPQLHIPAFAYSVFDMVMMGRAPHLGWLQSPKSSDHSVVEEALELVGLTDLKERPYTEISGGERQLVLIARGLAQKCRILLMDEPTAHLDLSNQHRVLEIIDQLSRQGLAFIISSHAPNDALSYADNVLLLNGGWVTDYGKPQEILTESALSAVYGVRTEVIYQVENGQSNPRAVVPRKPLTIRPDSIKDPKSILGSLFKGRDHTQQLIIVTGLSGAGKTTWCQNLVKNAKSENLSINGILSPGRFQGDKKIGINIVNLASGEEKKLASLNEKDQTRLSTPRWAFNADSMIWANQVLENANVWDLLIIDEIGPLELLRNEGLLAGLKLIDEGRYKVACVVVRSSLLLKALQRWPEALVINGRI